MINKILVTGADGFIGSHLVEALVNQGYSVKAFVLYNSFNSWGWLDTLPKEVLSKVEIFTGNITQGNHRDASDEKQGGMSHDRTPIIGILIGERAGSTEYLRQGDQAEEQEYNPYHSVAHE